MWSLVKCSKLWYLYCIFLLPFLPFTLFYLHLCSPPVITILMPMSMNLFFLFFIVVQVPLSPFSPHPSHPHSPPLILAPFGFVHVSFIHVPANPFPFSPIIPAHLPSGHCQFVPNQCKGTGGSVEEFSFFFLAPALHMLPPPMVVSLLSICEAVCIFLVSPVCSLASTYEWNHMVYVLLWWAYFT